MQQLKKELYKLLNVNSNIVFLDFIPPKDENDNELDYNNIFITYSLGDIKDLGHRQIIYLDIEIISKLDNRSGCEEKAEEIDSILNNIYIKNCNAKIIHDDIYYNKLNDLEEDKTIIRLNYIIV